MSNELSSQKYTNNIRSVSGTPTIYRDDVTLNCNTSSAACTINLMEIPANHWMTTWELLVVDASNNAATYNITIVAPTGFKINGAQQVVITSNGGSFLIKIANNTNFVGTYSAVNISGSQGGVSYLYAPKLLQTAGTYYSAVSAGTRSVVSGADVTSYDSKVESGVTGFDISTGVWTVPTTGYYSVAAKLVTRINPTDIDSNVDGGGLGWMTNPVPDGVGFIAIAVIITRSSGGGLKTWMACSNKQLINSYVSDVNIECTALEYPFVAGDTVIVRVLNKTDHAIVGIANSSTLPNCYIDFSVKSN